MVEEDNVLKKRGRPKGSQNKKTASNVYEYNSALPCSMFYEDSIVDCPIDLERILEFKESPMFYNKELRDLSWWAYRTNGTISSGIDYMRSMHTLDKVVYCKSDNKSESFKNKKLKNKTKFESVLETIKYKKFIRDAILKDFNDGIIFYYFETTSAVYDNNKFLSDTEILNITEINQLGINASIISLPTDYCKIIGKKNSSYVVAFDLRYFSKFNETDVLRKLKAFPKEIRNGWTKYNQNNNIQPWIVLDNNKTIVHKIKSSDNEPWGIPLTIASLDDILYANRFINTKRNLLNDLNNQIFYETFPEGDTKGKSALTGSQQEAQHNMIKTALFNSNNKFGKAFFSLATGTKLDQIKVDTSIFDEKNESNVKNNISTDIGIESSILGGESKSNYATSSLNIECLSAYVYSIITEITDELNKVINANIIKDKQCIIKMSILPTTFINKDDIVRYMSDLYARGKGSLTYWIASTGADVESYYALMDEELENDIENKYPVHATSFTMSGKDTVGVDKDHSGGRPEDKTSNNENTIASKTSNGNKNPKPSI